jgi:hypothetical protein
MLYLRKVDQLAAVLGTSAARLSRIAESIDLYIKEKEIVSAARPDRPRKVINVTGVARRFQSDIHRKLLVPRHRPSVHSHGGIRRAYASLFSGI